MSGERRLRLVAVTRDLWQGGNDWGGELRGDELTWEAIDERIRALDADERTLVTLAAGEEVPHLHVGGGDGHYVVEASEARQQAELGTVLDVVFTRGSRGLNAPPSQSIACSGGVVDTTAVMPAAGCG